MNKLRCLAAAMTLALFVSTAAIAGDIQGVGTPCPGDIQGVGCSAPNPGDSHTPGLPTPASDVDRSSDVSIGASVIAELLSMIF